LRSRRAIVAAVVLALVLVGAIGAYAYDHSRRDTIADGIRVGGIDVGGLKLAAARARLERRLLGALRRPVLVTYHGRRFVLSARAAGVAVNVGGLVDQALARSRAGSFVTRIGREVTGGTIHADLRPHVIYDHAALAAFVGRVAAQLDRPARDASIAFAPASLSPVTARDGVAVAQHRLRVDVARALASAEGSRTVTAQAHTIKPSVTTAQLAGKYGTVITVDRAHFRLRLWKRLKLVKTYVIAVGRAGLETPAGVYTINDKQVNPSWHVPNSSWAGKLAGKVIPPGPDDPIKARWMGIYAGAGIHGTDELSSLGSAASHGCIRMAIPDVIDLYDRTPYGTTVYIA
jgi:lipoprotein-anchoring transpeptidase ErfK/SrfK